MTIKLCRAYRWWVLLLMLAIFSFSPQPVAATSSWEGDHWLVSYENLCVGETLPREIPASETWTFEQCYIVIPAGETLTVKGTLQLANASTMMLDGGNLHIIGLLRNAAALTNLGGAITVDGRLLLYYPLTNDGNLLINAGGQGLIDSNIGWWNAPSPLTVNAGGTLDLVAGMRLTGRADDDGVLQLHQGQCKLAYDRGSSTTVFTIPAGAKLTIRDLTIPENVQFIAADGCEITVDGRLDCLGTFVIAANAKITLAAGAKVTGIPELETPFPDYGAIAADRERNGDGCTDVAEGANTLRFSGMIPWRQDVSFGNGSYVSLKITAPGGTLTLADKLTYYDDNGYKYQSYVVDELANDGATFIFDQPIQRAGTTFTLEVYWGASGQTETFTIQIDDGAYFERGARFVTGNGQNLLAVSANRLGYVFEPSPPSRDGYSFAGWYHDENYNLAHNFDQVVDDSLVLYAKWIKNATSVYWDIGEGDDTHWAYEEIIYMSRVGVVNGYPDGSFRPDNTMTRAEFVKVLAATDGIDSLYTGAYPFTDLRETWYRPYIAWAYQNQIVFGQSATTFAPDSQISRQDMVTLIYRFLSYRHVALTTSGSIPAFADFAEVADYAKEAVTIMQKTGFINGRGDHRFEPTAQTTRAEVVTLVARLLRAYPELAEKLTDT